MIKKLVSYLLKLLNQFLQDKSVYYKKFMTQKKRLSENSKIH